MLRSGGPLFEDDEELSLLPRGNLSRRRSGGGGCCQLCRRVCVCTVRLGLFCAAAACAVAVALLYIGPRSGTRSKVHTLEAEVLTQRKQLQRLQSQLARGASAPGPNSPCIDRWEVQYPAELDVWNGHSCMWKQMWGQCDKFARQCRRTCGRCVSAPEQGGGEEQEAEEEGEAEEGAAESSAEDARQAAGTAAVEPESPVPKPGPGPGADAQAARVGGGDAESLLQALRAREETVRLGKPGSVLSKPGRAVGRQSQAGANGGETAQEGDDDDDDRTEEIDGDGDEDEEEGEDGEDGASYGQALSAAKTLESARRPASKSSAQPSSDRQNYVAGDSTTVVSAGSECGIPTQSPAASKGLDMGVLATKNFGADSRSYSSVTYLSGLVSMQPGEVHHYQHSVQLPRPADARGIQSYVMEILEQRGSELRPAPEVGIHLKRFMLQQQAPPASGRSCDTQAVLFAGEGARGAEVTFPHPFVVQPDGDTWHAQLHVVRTDGLTIPLSDARQCICAASWLETYGSLARMGACSPRLLWPRHPPSQPFALSGHTGMRASIGSTRCCPHACLYPVAAEGPHTKAAQYRLSIVVTWLLAGSEPTATVRPMRALWLPSGPNVAEPQPAPEELRRVACLGQWSLLSEFELPACTPPSPCSYRSTGARRRLSEAALLIVALGVANDRMTGASLWARGADQGSEQSLSSKCRREPTAHRAAPCVFPAGEALPQETQLQVRAEWNTSRAVLGADVGFVLWVA